MYKASYKKYQLLFKKNARTSRGEMQTHDVYYLRLERIADGKVTYGEAAPLKGLSIDDVADFNGKFRWLCDAINNRAKLDPFDLTRFPSMAFALETALLAMNHQEDFKLFDTPFYNNNQPIEINGLVWMDTADAMLAEALEKAGQGFRTIKFKVGALDFDAECRMLESFRKRHNAFKIELRLDANGAFKSTEVLEQLKELSRFGVHSIEQPVKAGQHELMEEVCAKSAIPVALDEELIGVDVEKEGASLLNMLKPAYIILKPTLLGGLQKSDQWVKAATLQETGWWATSALESNIGLNAIAQWASGHYTDMPQGLGTGSLYTNNISSPLEVSTGTIRYNASKKWDLSALHKLFS